MEVRLTQIIVAIVCVGYIIKGIQETRHYLNYTIPHQLLQLVQQAHTGRSNQTLWNIETTEEMRRALCVPLTSQQIDALSKLGAETISTSVTGYVLSHKLRDSELSGVVCVSINISSSLGTYNYEYSNVKLRITVRHVGKPLVSDKWIVSSVEQIQ